MNLNKILIAVIIIIVTLFVLTAVRSNKNNSLPAQKPPVAEVYDEQNAETSESAPVNNAEGENSNQPNAINVIAPGYNNAQQKIQQLKEIKQQAIEEQKKSIEGER